MTHRKKRSDNRVPAVVQVLRHGFSEKMRGLDGLTFAVEKKALVEEIKPR